MWAASPMMPPSIHSRFKQVPLPVSCSRREAWQISVLLDRVGAWLPVRFWLLLLAVVVCVAFWCIRNAMSAALGKR